MTLDISYIPPGLLSKALEGMHEYFSKSEDWTRGRATVNDIRFHKIPNWLTYPSILIGIIYNTIYERV
jgi:hypothetical protein